MQATSICISGKYSTVSTSLFDVQGLLVVIVGGLKVRLGWGKWVWLKRLSNSMGMFGEEYVFKPFQIVSRTVGKGLNLCRNLQ